MRQRTAAGTVVDAPGLLTAQVTSRRRLCQAPLTWLHARRRAPTPTVYFANAWIWRTHKRHSATLWSAVLTCPRGTRQVLVQDVSAREIPATSTAARGGLPPRFSLSAYCDRVRKMTKRALAVCCLFDGTRRRRQRARHGARQPHRRHGQPVLLRRPLNASSSTVGMSVSVTQLMTSTSATSATCTPMTFAATDFRS